VVGGLRAEGGPVAGGADVAQALSGLVYRDDTGPTAEYRLRLDRQTWQVSRDGSPCTITGLTPCLAMFGLGNTTRATKAPVPET
jgi:hypothetical protein